MTKRALGLRATFACAISAIPVLLAAMASVACGTKATPGLDTGSSSSTSATTGEAPATTDTGGSSTVGPVVDESGSSTSTSTNASTGDTSTGDPPAEPVCSSTACFVECTRELETKDAQGMACTCISVGPWGDDLPCDLPARCGFEGYTCIIEGLRDGMPGRYSWSYVEKDVGGETVQIEVLEPGHARGVVATFDELACCGVQSVDNQEIYYPFDLRAPDDPYWVECLALADGIQDQDPVPDCLRPDALRMGDCVPEPLDACPPAR